MDKTLKDLTDIIHTEHPDDLPVEKHDLISWTNNFYVKAATSDNTRKAYRSDIRHFEAWGGRLPASTEMIVRYLHDLAPLLNPRTLARRLTALKAWHIYQSFPDPTQHTLVAKTLKGIARIHGKPKDKAPPLTPEDLLQMVSALQNHPSLAACRDNALLLIGFFGALRRSELVAIQFEHLRWEKEGLEILLPSSKTDQLHEGQYCVIPEGNNALSPGEALRNWLKRSRIQSGPIFRRIIAHDQLGLHALTPLAINQMIKRRASEVGIKHAQQLSSHSMRRGLATSAARAGAQLPAIMRAGRWKQTNTVMEYIEASERFSENAAASVMQKVREGG